MLVEILFNNNDNNIYIYIYTPCNFVEICSAAIVCHRPPSPHRHDIVFVQPLRQGKRQYCSILIRLGGLYVQNDILVKCPRCGALNMAIHHAGDMYVGPPPDPGLPPISPHSSPSLSISWVSWVSSVGGGRSL